jgi:hypothetical protein
LNFVGVINIFALKNIRSKNNPHTSEGREMMLLAIDPGNVESAYVIVDEDLKPVEFGKVENHELLKKISGNCGNFYDCSKMAIEMIQNLGMPAVGETLFETCVWVGRFIEASVSQLNIEPVKIYRREEKINLCGSMKAKDSNIRQALIDRFGEVGTKKAPGWFYGFKADIWQAYACGVTYHDKHMQEVTK